MNQVEFNELGKEQQMESLYLLGFVIGIRKDKKNSYMFYCIEDFFAEVKYEESAIKEIHSFRGSKQLALYSQRKPLQLQYAS